MTLTIATEAPVLGDTITSSELIAVSGISYRMLDFWTRAGYLKPDKATPGHGNPRRFLTLLRRFPSG